MNFIKASENRWIARNNAYVIVQNTEPKDRNHRFELLNGAGQHITWARSLRDAKMLAGLHSEGARF